MDNINLQTVIKNTDSCSRTEKSRKTNAGMASVMTLVLGAIYFGILIVIVFVNVPLIAFFAHSRRAREDFSSMMSLAVSHVGLGAVVDRVAMTAPTTSNLALNDDFGRHGDDWSSQFSLAQWRPCRRSSATSSSQFFFDRLWSSRYSKQQCSKHDRSTAWNQTVLPTCQMAK